MVSSVYPVESLPPALSSWKQFATLVDMLRPRSTPAPRSLLPDAYMSPLFEAFKVKSALLRQSSSSQTTTRIDNSAGKAAGTSKIVVVPSSSSSSGGGSDGGAGGCVQLQEDAMEFLTSLLDSFHEEMCQFSEDEAVLMAAIEAASEDAAWTSVKRPGVKKVVVDDSSRIAAAKVNSSTIISRLFHGTLKYV